MIFIKILTLYKITFDKFYKIKSKSDKHFHQNLQCFEYQNISFKHLKHKKNKLDNICLMKTSKHILDNTKIFEWKILMNYYI